jgi:hypothetical protein
MIRGSLMTEIYIETRKWFWSVAAAQYSAERGMQLQSQRHRPQHCVTRPIKYSKMKSIEDRTIVKWQIASARFWI